MAVTTGRIYVPAPNPIIPRYGLFRVATGPLDLPMHARNGGLEYQTSVCDLPIGYEVNCEDSDDPSRDKTFPESIDTITGDPFVVYSSYTCGIVGLVNWGRDRVRQYLYNQLVAGEQATVERLFSIGTVGVSPSLVGAVNLGNAQGPVQAVSILEEWLYERYGLPGVIHAPMAAAPYLSGSHVVYLDGSAQTGIWRTNVGTAVSLGNYAGTGPSGQVPAAGDTWLYITGQVAVWRTPDSELFVPDMSQAINRSTNVLTTVMEREYVLTYDCYAAAVQVTLDTTDQ